MVPLPARQIEATVSLLARHVRVATHAVARARVTATNPSNLYTQPSAEAELSPRPDAQHAPAMHTSMLLLLHTLGLASATGVPFPETAPPPISPSCVPKSLGCWVCSHCDALTNALMLSHATGLRSTGSSATA